MEGREVVPFVANSSLNKEWISLLLWDLRPRLLSKAAHYNVFYFYVSGGRIRNQDEIPPGIIFIH
jgi:hypothetical protein